MSANQSTEFIVTLTGPSANDFTPFNAILEKARFAITSPGTFYEVPGQYVVTVVLPANAEQAVKHICKVRTLPDGTRMEAKVKPARDPRLDEFAQAVRDNDTMKAKKLIAQGIDVNALADNRFYLLHWALRFHNTDVASALLGRGANPNKPMGNNEITPAMVAAKEGLMDFIDVLCTFGADLSLETKAGTLLSVSRTISADVHNAVLDKIAARKFW